MTIVEGVILACWAIFLLYWGITSLTVKPTQETKWKIGHARWVILGIVIILFVIRYFGLLNLPDCQVTGCHLNVLNNHLTSSLLLQILSLVLTVGGLAVAITARNEIGRNWSSNIDVKKDHQLITSGVYHYIRHPIYTGVLLMMLGNVIFFSKYWYFSHTFVYGSFFYFQSSPGRKIFNYPF